MLNWLKKIFGGKAEKIEEKPVVASAPIASEDLGADKIEEISEGEKVEAEVDEELK